MTSKSGKSPTFLDGKVTSRSSAEDVRKFYETDGVNWSDNYKRKPGEKIAINPAILRLNLVHKLVDRYGCDNMFDAGCADAPVMLDMLRRGKTIRGIDFSPALVAKGKERLQSEGYTAELCEVGDVTATGLPASTFDTVLCLGVLPHIERLDLALAELVRIAKPGATLILSFRNDLFDLFTFNRLTTEFFSDHFLAAVPCSEDMRARARELLAGLIVNPNVPAPDYTDSGISSFGSVTRINHNPLTIGEQLKSYGLDHQLNCYYKFHPFPPLLEKYFADFRELGAQMDQTMSFSWQGMFMCSTFIAVLKKVA